MIIQVIDQVTKKSGEHNNHLNGIYKLKKKKTYDSVDSTAILGALKYQEIEELHKRLFSTYTREEEQKLSGQEDNEIRRRNLSTLSL